MHVGGSSDASSFYDESARNWGRKASLDGTLYTRWLTLMLARERDSRFCASTVPRGSRGTKQKQRTTRSPILRHCAVLLPTC